jgi:hypothetical protein
MGDINVSYQIENNYSASFNFSGSHYGLGYGFQLADWPLTAAVTMGYSSHRGLSETNPKLWDASIGFGLSADYKVGPLKFFAGLDYSIGAGRIKHNDTLDEQQPCQFLTACQLDRMLGTFSVNRLALEVGVEYGYINLQAGLTSHWFDANDGVVVPSTSLGWFVGIGLRL